LFRLAKSLATRQNAGMAKLKPKRRRVIKPGEPTGSTVRFQPTQEQRESATQLKACGWTTEQIAMALRIPLRTFERHFTEEIKRGEFHVKSIVSRNIAVGAMNGDRTLMIFYAKAMMGWRDHYRVGFEDDKGNAVNPANLFAINITGMEPK
jgi:hypothetical protein